MKLNNSFAAAKVANPFNLGTNRTGNQLVLNFKAWKWKLLAILTSFDINNLMEELSSTFLKPIPVSAEDLKAHAANLEALKAKGGSDELPESPKFYETVESKDVQAAYYVAVLFTAEYAPPCV